MFHCLTALLARPPAAGAFGQRCAVAALVGLRGGHVDPLQRLAGGLYDRLIKADCPVATMRQTVWRT